ncbi:MAG: hypothetical protein ACOC5T_07145 [Elusimicrobiota bacterium]
MNNIKEYKGTEYLVYWFDEVGHYNGYVRILDNHPYNKKVDKKEKVFGEEVSTGYDDIPIDCHGGLTFSVRITKRNKYPQGFTEGAWIGWDYAHSGDKTKYFEGKEWTAEEVEEECKNVINQLKKL